METTAVKNGTNGHALALPVPMAKCADQIRMVLGEKGPQTADALAELTNRHIVTVYSALKDKDFGTAGTEGRKQLYTLKKTKNAKPEKKKRTAAKTAKKFNGGDAYQEFLAVVKEMVPLEIRLGELAKKRDALFAKVKHIE